MHTKSRISLVLGLLVGIIQFTNAQKFEGIAHYRSSMNFNAMRDPADLFLRQRTGDIMDEIEAEYKPDLMVFDMPPMLINDDTSAFLKHVDASLIVVEAGVSTIDQVDLCEKELALQTNVLGMLLNKCRFQSDGYGYYSNYGAKY